jgi:hypothetical protein
MTQRLSKLTLRRPEHQARRTIIRGWMSLPRDKGETPEQAAAFARKATGDHELACSGDPQPKGNGLAIAAYGQTLVCDFRAGQSPAVFMSFL